MTKTRPPRRSFASDNNAGVHPEIVEAIRTVNEGHVVAYGDDEITARAVKLFKKHFGKDIEVSKDEDGALVIQKADYSTVDGHMLFTVSINFKILNL